MSFPTFGLDEDGNIITDSEDVYGYFTPAPSPTALPGLADSGDVSAGDVSSGDQVVIIQQDNSELLQSIDEGVSLLAAQSVYTTGYLSTSALDTFDRVVAGLDYRYYVAYRYDADSYNSLLYLSNSVSSSADGFTLADALQVQLYRVRVSSSSSTYTYHYTVSQAGDVTMSTAGNPIYYTNCLVGYPLLGGLPAPSHYPTWAVLLFAVLLVLCLLMIRRGRK